MKPTPYNLLLAACYITALSGLYIADTPHPAALTLTAFGYIIFRQYTMMDRHAAIMALQGATIEMQRETIVSLREEREAGK